MNNISQKVIEYLMDDVPPTYNAGPTYDEIIFPEGYEKPTRELFEKKFNELLNKKLIDDLRVERNKKLIETDYIFLRDYVHKSTEIENAWVEYRQALRDLPANTADPENPVWPQAPE